jgi:hypothetical protein
MQNGYPKDLVDYWGDESTGQSQIPEALPTGSVNTMYWLDQYSKKYHYDKPVTTAYEWVTRDTNPGDLTELEQAQYYTRDALGALAFGAPNINIGIIHDVGDAYWYSRWGAGGLTHRYPLMTPKPSYVALSVLTQQLDQATFKRMVPTDSPTLYVQEYAQGNGFVYVVWVPRGQKPAQLTFSEGARVTGTDMNGQAVPLAAKNGEYAVMASASPQYFHSSAPLTRATSGDTETAAPPPTTVVVDSLTGAGAWSAVTEPNQLFETAHFDYPRQVGKIAVSVVPDKQKQSALQLTLQPQSDLAWPIGRYVSLKPAQPVTLPGTPEAVGVWVNGNSSWGRVFFQVEYAKGQTFFSIGPDDGGWMEADWKAKTNFNFDGWNYISVKLPKKYSSGFYMPRQNNWRISGDGNVAYPVKITGLVVVLRDKVMQSNHLVTVPNASVSLWGLGGY